MVMAKSSTGVKSPTAAVPATTDTGTDRAAVGAVGWDAPPNPVKVAVTVISAAAAPSVTEPGSRVNVILLSPSKMNRSPPNTVNPAEEPDRFMNSEPSNNVSSKASSRKLAFPLVEPAGMVMTKSSTAPPAPAPRKSLAAAVPPEADTDTGVSSPGKPGSPSPPKPTNSAVTVISPSSPSAMPSGLTRKATPRLHPPTPAAGS